MAADLTLYENLRDRVVVGKFVPGQRLRPEVLREDYGCSASTIREALFRLSTVGLVDFQEQRGFRLPRFSEELCSDLTQLRILLECEGARLSIRYGGVAWEARLSAAHHRLSHIESHVGSGGESDELLLLWTDAELEFHQTLIDACGSQVLKETHAMIYRRFRQQLINIDRKFLYLPENVEQHSAILEAALAHDEDLTCARIRAHLSRHLISPAAERIAESA